MPKSITVHLGTWKTGTTSIQRFLTERRDVLKTNGWLYPVTGCPDDFETGWGHHLIARAIDAENGALMNALADKLRNEFDASNCEHVLLSSEDFFGLYNYDYFGTIWNSSEINFIVSLRPQHELLNSNYYTELFHVKKDISPEDYYSRFYVKKSLDYLQKLTDITERYPKSEIKIRVFDVGQPARLDAICDFIEALGLPLDPNEPRSGYRDHPTLGRDHTLALRFFLGEQIYEEQFFYRLFLATHRLSIAHKNKMDKTSYPFMSYRPSFCADLYERHRRSNRSLRVRFGDGEDRDLFVFREDIKDEAWEGSLPTIPEAARRLLDEIVIEYVLK